MKNPEFKNIPQNGIIAKEIQRREERVSVSLFESGIITLSWFAIAQFILGAQLNVENSVDKFIPDSDTKLKLLSKLSIYLLPQPESKELFEIYINRKELIVCKLWLETRMQHCEKERDERSEKFNPDTYIGQKLLLIDIRELLLADIK